jgi:hypothetical protein
MSLLPWPPSTVIANTADLESAGDYFFLAGKTHNGTVRGIFRGGRDLFDP